MLNASLAESSKETYKRAWHVFDEFSMSLFGRVLQTPIDVSTIALFVAYLHNSKMSYRTINTYLSAVAYVQKMLNLQNPTTNFLITNLVRGSQSLQPSYDMRLPITIHILNKLVESLMHVSQTHYHRLLFTAMFLFAFHTFARVGEITSTPGKSSNHVVLIEDIDIIYIGGSQCKVSVTFKNFKHSKGKPHVLVYDRGETQVSPIDALLEYLQIRNKQPGPLFILNNGLMVSRSMFDNQLKKCLLFCGFDSSRYKSHSFRIGQATYCALKGYSDAYICSVGRWNSSSFRRYVRI